MDIRFLSKFKRFLDKSIKKKIFFLYTVIIILPMLIVSGSTLLWLLNKLNDTYIYEKSNYLNLINHNFIAYMEDFDRITTSLQLSKPIQEIIESPANSKQWVKNQMKFSDIAFSSIGLRQEVEGVYLYDIEKDFLYYETDYPGIKYVLEDGYCIQNEDWYKYILQSENDFEILGLHKQGFKNNESTNVVTISRKIKDLDTLKTIGIVFIDLKEDILEKFNIDKKEAKGEEIYMLDSYNITNNNILTNNLKAKDSVLIIESEENKYGWKFINSINNNSFIGKNLYLLGCFILINIIFIVTTLLLTLYISRIIIRPIDTIIDTMKDKNTKGIPGKVNINTNQYEFKKLQSDYNYMIENIELLIKENYEKDIINAKAEIKALQSQINPHFLYNTLESINAMATIEDNDEISELVVKLGKLFRYNISNNSNSIVSIKEEIDNICDYCNIQKVNYSDNFQMFYKIDEELKEYKTIKSIIQPIVENAIYHGIEKGEGQRYVKINVEEKEDNIIFNIINNGKLIEENTLNDINNKLSLPVDEQIVISSGGKHIGLININLRLKLNYGEGYGLLLSRNVNSNESIVKIKIPKIM